MSEHPRREAAPCPATPKASQRSPERVVSRTQVAIVGAGPAGLMLAHLLHRAGISSTAVDVRTREQIETTHRAGILEAGNAELLVESGVSDRVLRDGHEHEGTSLRFGGRSHRIDFKKLVGRSVWLYPQTDVFIDLADARERDGGDVRFGVTDTDVGGLDGERPWVRFTDAAGVPHEVNAEFVVGADGSRSRCRDLIPAAQRTRYATEYPFAWFGILCQAPPSAPELIYVHSEHGFALVSRRTDDVQRMYFQCDPHEDVTAWDDTRIWERLQACLHGGDGVRLRQGPVFDKAVLRFRSFVQEPMHWGRLVLVGDAAHTVPPTGARGLNLALADVSVLAQVLPAALSARDPQVLVQYQQRALQRVWRAQNFSYWMTQMLHLGNPNAPDAAFEMRRQLGELENVVSTRAGRTYLAEQYTGWPSPQ